MKNIFAFLIIICLSTSYMYGSIEKKNSSAGIQKTLSIAVGTGATISFFFWLPATIAQVVKYGLVDAFAGTYIPRLMIDAGTVALAVMAYKNADQTDLQKTNN